MLGVLDWIIIIAYLVLMVVIGIACRGRQDDARDYFTTSGSLGGTFGSILVGLSIAATLFSGISFLVYPSVIYSSGLVIVLSIVTFPVMWVILRFWFLPRYLSSPGTRPYDMIEQRFGLTVRTSAAVLFVLLRVGWMAALIYSPTLAISAAAGLGDQWLWPMILTIGLSSTIYTVLGGIRGVIITDAIQFLVIAVGIGFAILYVTLNVPVASGQAWQLLHDSGRLQWFEPSLSLSAVTTWAVLISVLVGSLGSYMADQMSLQRYLAAGSARSASRSFAVNVVGVIVVLLLLAMVGLSMVLWYAAVEDPNLPADPDRIFPYFIATQLPGGVAGGLLAAILAATMSSMTSGINALSASMTMDFRERFGKTLTAKQELRFARIVSLLVGLAATGAAGVVHKMGDIFQISQGLLGVFLGPLLCCILLCMVRRVIHPRAMLLGLLLGCLAGWVIIFSHIHNMWASPTAFLVCFTTSILSSLLVRAKNNLDVSIGQ